MKKVDRTFPLPEAISPDGPGARGRKSKTAPPPWRIEESPFAAVDLANRRMMVPLDESERSLFLRAHEQGHVKWTPKNAERPADIPEMCLQAAEDNRINSLLRKRAHIAPAAPLLPLEAHEQLVKNWQDGKVSDLDIAAMLLAANGTPDGELLTSIVRESDYADPEDEAFAGHELADAVKLIARKNHDSGARKPQYSDSLKVARAMAERFTGRFSSAGEARLASADAADETESVPKPSGISDEDKKDWLVRRALSRGKVGDPVGPTGRHEMKGRDWVPSGRMEVVKERLTEAYPARMKGPKPRPTDEGSVFAHPHRLLTDGRVFRTKRRKIGRATILIDVSGSMSLDPEDVRNMIGAMPAATVAIYSGMDDYGILRIIAANGRRCRGDRMHNRGMGGNIIDVPSLKWLAKQDGPRIWVCDGGVTGVGDSGGENINNECARIATRAQILRVPNIATADALMKRLRYCG